MGREEEVEVEFEVDDEDYEVEEVADDAPMHIVDRVSLGSIDAARNIPALKRANVGITLGLLGVDDERVVADGGDGIRRVLVQMEDSLQERLFERLPALINTMEDALRYAQNHDCNMLVHCMAGRSRSPSLVAGWLLATHKFSLSAAIDRIQRIRPWIEINSHFQSDLQLFDQVTHYQSGDRFDAHLSRHNGLPRLDFGINLVTDILSEKKTVTMRLASDITNDANSDLQHIYAHSTVVATSTSTQQCATRETFAILRVDKLSSNVSLSEIDYETLMKTGFTSVLEVLSVLKEFYPDITMQTPLIVLHFKRLSSKHIE